MHDDKLKKDALTLKLDFRLISVALIIVIAGMLAFWQPWNRTSDRTIEVTGQSKVTAVPDEFLFAPTYEFKNTDKQAALNDLSKKSDEFIAKLKELGVADEKIKTNSGSYDYFKPDDKTATTYTYNLTLTVTIDNKELAQKVQDYLVTTSPTGSVSPTANFSDKKRNELEAQARNEATKDARAKAEQSAKNLGFSLGPVKAVSDGAGFGNVIYPAYAGDTASPTRLSVQPGENDLNYSVTVTYFVY